jgi:phosphoribosyl 1,2-cyclic phosphodiesterase
MIIRCWGARGSIPVSGQGYLKYGGNTTCIEVRTKGNEVVIVDAGSGIRNIGNALVRENQFEYSILFTHYHWDHLLGLPFFKPIYLNGAHIDVYGPLHRQDSLNETISKVMVAPYFPVDLNNVPSDIVYHEVGDSCFQIKSLMITPISLSHPNLCLGYRIVEDDKCFVFFTDNELTFKHPGALDHSDYLDFASHADLLFHDAQFIQEEYELRKGWGHSVHTHALSLALESDVRGLGLFHHDPERTDDALDAIIEDCKQSLANSVANNLDCFAVYEGMEIKL